MRRSISEIQQDMNFLLDFSLNINNCKINTMLLPNQNYLYYRTQFIKLLERDLKRKYSILEWMKVIYQVLNIGPIVGFHSIVGNKVGPGPISPLERTINNSIHRIVIAFWNDMDQVEWGVPGYAIIQDIIKLFYLDLYEIYVNGNEIVRDHFEA